MFPRFLSKKLHDKDISQRELSNRMGIHESLVSKWMKGERIPTLPNIIKLAKILEVEIEEIMKAMEIV